VVGTTGFPKSFRFSLPPDFDVMQKVIHACGRNETEEMEEADAFGNFSCAGRFVSTRPP